MKLLKALRGLATRRAKPKPAAWIMRGVTDLSDEEVELYHAEVNAAAERKRSENAAALDALLGGGRPRWVPRRGRGWLS